MAPGPFGANASAGGSHGAEAAGGGLTWAAALEIDGASGALGAEDCEVNGLEAGVIADGVPLSGLSDPIADDPGPPGMGTMVWHLGQRAFFPAASSGVRMRVWQVGQSNSMAMSAMPAINPKENQRRLKTF
jgi:hypothetical protein